MTALRQDFVNENMFVIKRNSKKQVFLREKINSRIKKSCYGLNTKFVYHQVITEKVIKCLYAGVTTAELDNFVAETAATMTNKHPDYAVLAARIAVSNLHKETKKRFSDVMMDLFNIVDEKSGLRTPLIAEKYHTIIQENAGQLNSAIVYDRDFNYNYFGFKTLERFYLLNINGKVAERPQHMFMRVAIGIHEEDIHAAIETYNLMSEQWFTHDPPTMFCAATTKAQLSSCFLLTMKEDSIEGIYDTLKQCALICECVGEIGLNIHCIRSTGSYIGGTNSTSNGLVPMLRVYNNTAKVIVQRSDDVSAIAIYLEPWHPDIFEFLKLKKNHGKEENRARDLNYAMWIPDIFMERVKNAQEWSLMCPKNCPGLSDCWGEQFDGLYEMYERKGKARKTVPAQKLWYAILETQIETGMPYMLYKDTCNRKSNQNNLGTIKCSNLCTEVVQYSSPDEVAVCNLASIALNMYVTPDGAYDFKKLKEVSKVVTRNLNKLIDVNCFPVPESERSNKLHRPIGIGVQGLADAFILMRYPFESQEAKKLNRKIFETIYYGALEASCELAKVDGPYETYKGSPASLGIFQYDMWNVTPTDLWDWNSLKKNISEYGLRNSLLLALMPTASTAQIFGNNESFEACTSNINTCRISSGEFQIINSHLIKDLTEKGLWNDDMKNKLKASNGSIQNIPEIDSEIKSLYKTVWEIPQRTIIDMAADRGAFIDQSQAMKIYIAEPNLAKLTSMHFYAWKKGLKTGMYKLHTRQNAQ